MAILKQKQAELAEIEAHIQKLKDNIDKKNSEFKVYTAVAVKRINLSKLYKF